jgi:hypothetical protein
MSAISCTSDRRSPVGWRPATWLSVRVAREGNDMYIDRIPSADDSCRIAGGAVRDGAAGTTGESRPRQTLVDRVLVRVAIGFTLFWLPLSAGALVWIIWG